MGHAEARVPVGQFQVHVADGKPERTSVKLFLREGRSQTEIYPVQNWSLEKP